MATIENQAATTALDMLDKIEELGPVGSAILETKMSWEPQYRMRLPGTEIATAWGEYEDTFCLAGKYYISPYWTEGDNWLELSAEEALRYTAIHVPTSDGIHHGETEEYLVFEGAGPE